MQTTTQTFPVDMTTTVRNIGMVMMTFAATFALVHLPEGHTQQPHETKQAFVFETKTAEPTSTHGAERTPREEVGPHHTNMSVAQRTPGRTGF